MKFLSEIRICPWDRESHNARDKKRGKTYRRTILFSIFSIAGPVWPEDARDLPLIWKDSSCSHMMQSFRYKRNYTKLCSREQSTFINSVAGLSISATSAALHTGALIWFAIPRISEYWTKIADSHQSHFKHHHWEEIGNCLGNFTWRRRAQYKNTQIWLNKDRIQTFPRVLPSSSDVLVLLLRNSFGLWKLNDYILANYMHDGKSRKTDEILTPLVFFS